jgi:Kef-type K+ transport system membrane component KefB
VLFIGTAMSITALPVLTRILSDWRMLQTTIGTIAMGCAAIDDIVAWTLLGVVAGLVRGEVAGPGMALLVAAYLGVMAFIVRPLLERVLAFRATPSGRVLWLVAVVAVAVGSIEAAEWIGIHAVFGAFLAGVCVPRRADVLEGLESPLRRVSTWLMPAFFVLIGLKTALRLLNGADAWILTAVILGCAVLGKLGGSSLGARTLGFSWRDSLAIGALLDTRGLVGLVVLDIGRSLGILSPPLFAMFVIMTFVTTFATVPLLRLIGLRPGSA